MGILRDFTSSTKRKKIGNTKLAYVAGIFDGEGYICIFRNRGKYRYLRVGVCNTDKSLTDYLVELFGGFVQVQLPKPGMLRKKIYYSWHVSDPKWFLKLLKPYVRLKRQRLEVALAFISLPSNALVKRRRLGEKMMTLNA